MKTKANSRLYIFGAGLSHSYNKDIFPLTNNLIKKAFDLKLLEKKETLRAFVSDIFNESIDNINFEKVASFLYNNPFSSEGEPKQTYDLLYIELISIISLIYGNPNLVSADTEKWKIDTLNAFSTHFQKSDSTIISFNYDLLIEHYLQKNTQWNPIYGYHMPFYPPFSYQPYNDHIQRIGGSILKLHGSLNWGLPPEEILNAKYEKLILDTENYSETIFRTKYDSLYFTNNKLYPYLIPPVAGKIYENFIMRNLWRKAKAAMQIYPEIHIIGYSLPESDTSVEFLFRLGSKETAPFGGQKIIHIVDPCIRNDKESEFETILKAGNSKNLVKIHKMDGMEYLKSLNYQTD
ncbi:hypothetical protein EHQ47_16725 [Leptospira bourretii]|uniref:SIR2 family protein n=1 Tax=Leptospira bourretii TaxID=2484962 RepID=UPI001090F27B|nr:SIR2 family protein [Leptospira bourretii]TGL19740.1 hypothetical protein EHQ47_16725 [Leptospira bourretii]